MFDRTAPENLDTVTKIDAFVACIQSLISRHYKENLTNLTAPTVEAIYDRKFCRIFAQKDNAGIGGHIIAFVALEDISTKFLGNVKKGSIMKPSTYKAPAKHARGNINEPDNNYNCLTYDGYVMYLK